MPALSAYSNVVNTALVVIRSKGFQVWYDKEQDLYYAEKDGWDFAAAGAVELLGVIAIFEFHHPHAYKEYWWRINAPDLEKGIPKQPDPYRPVWEK